MTPIRCAPALGWAALTSAFLAGIAARADDAPGTPAQPGAHQEFQTREAVDEYYREQRAALEGRHLEDLAAVAARQEGPEADTTYRQVFHLAIAHGLYATAERAAERVIAEPASSPDVQVLAHFVNVVAEADRGAFDESLDHLVAFIKGREEDAAPAQKTDHATVLALGEAYFQRLIHAGRYDIARRVCELAAAHAEDPLVKDHFAERSNRLNRVGSLAPPIDGTGVDGERVRLEDLRGKVVLISFWASWCPPCSQEMPRLAALAGRYRDKGLVVLGVNLDAARAEAGPPAQVRAAVRRFLIAHHVAFPNVINGDGPQDFAHAYGVTEIPVSFLVDRDGKIIHFELDDTNRERVVAEALGK